MTSLRGNVVHAVLGRVHTLVEAVVTLGVDELASEMGARGPFGVHRSASVGPAASGVFAARARHARVDEIRGRLFHHRRDDDLTARGVGSDLPHRV